jgi:hypothetical protein
VVIHGGIPLHKDWKPLLLYGVFAVLMPATICRLLWGSWSLESDFEAMFGGALSFAGMFIAYRLSER